jgi:hypothetical protein
MERIREFLILVGPSERSIDHRFASHPDAATTVQVGILHRGFG